MKVRDTISGTPEGDPAIKDSGNDLDNVLAWKSAANTLTGGAGNDTLGADNLKAAADYNLTWRLAA